MNSETGTLAAQGAMIFVLSFIGWEDFRYRAVQWWAFLLAALLAVIIEYEQLEFAAVLMNITFVLLQVLILTIYFSIKNKRIITITASYLGWGDIIFWLVCSLLFSPFNFMLYAVGSLLVSLLSGIVWKAVEKENVSPATIPLAGIQSWVLIVLLIYKSIFAVSLRNDDWVLKWLIV